MPSPRSILLLSPFLLGVAALAGTTLAASCGGSTGAVANSADATADGTHVDTGTATGDDGSPTGDDGSPNDDAEVPITEGGSNPDLDASDEGGDDTAPDGGACNTITNASPSVSSTCASEAPILGGGTLVAGTYYLTSVTAFGTAAFCKSDFIPVGIKETVQMTVTGGVGAADIVSELAMTKERRASVELTPGANDASPLTLKTTCPASTTSDQVKYEMRSTTAKTVLVLRLAYAKDEADYTFEKQ